MAEVVISPNEISLDSVRFPIKGGVRPALISTLPAKVTIGEYSLSDEQIASSWVISDQRGGVLVEEMDETIHLDKCWWSTCDLTHKGYIVLPPLATDCGSGGLSSKDAYFIADYASAIYAALDTKFRVWNETDGDFNDIVDFQIEDCEDAWDLYQNPSATIATDSGDYKEGSNSVKITVDSAISGEMLCIETITSDDLTNYERARLWIKSALATNTGDLQLHLCSGAGWMTPTGVTDYGGWGNDALIYDDNTGNYADHAGVVAAGGWSGYIGATLTATSCDSVRFWASSANGATHIDTVDIDAYYDSAWHDVYQGTFTHGEWITKYMPEGTQSVTEFRFRFQNNHASVTDTAYLHEVDFGIITTETIDVPSLSAGAWTDATGTITAPANLATVTKIGLKLVTDLGAEPYIIWIDDVGVYYDLPANPTGDAIVYQASGTDKLFIPCGTSYVIYDGTEVLEDTDDAEFFVEWDAKLFKIDSTGQLAYSTDGTTWTNNGKIKLGDDYVKSLFIYRDADGAEIIYAGTRKGLYAHDYTNAKFIETELSLPDHPTCGMGTTRWRDASYISAGLDVHKYISARTATISSVGLDEDDGLPSEYLGEITRLIKGYKEFYALVDAGYVAGTGYSSVMARNDSGWQCKWLSGTADKSIKCGLVSSTHDYRFWFGTDNKIYRITLNRSSRNPKKLSSYTYGSAGVHYTPWFDANWVGVKLALSLEVFCDDMTANETVTPSYRIDHVNTDIGTGWTALTAITSDGLTTYTLPTTASGAGISFKAIQFKFALARGGTNTNSPIIRYIKLKYLKILEDKWGWQATVDCSQKPDYKGRTPRQLDAALKTIVEKDTLVEFTFRNESGGTYTQKVKVANCVGVERTGEDWRSHYLIGIVEP